MRKFIAVLFVSVSFPAVAQQSYIIDWEATGEEAVQHLIDLVRIDTTNPPGNAMKPSDNAAIIVLRSCMDVTTCCFVRPSCAISFSTNIFGITP